MRVDEFQSQMNQAIDKANLPSENKKLLKSSLEAAIQDVFQSNRNEQITKNGKELLKSGLELEIGSVTNKLSFEAEKKVHDLGMRIFSTVIEGSSSWPPAG